jgi:phage regulator Rha-like protein
LGTAMSASRTAAHRPMSSREIAELVESRHDDVCRTIERLIASKVIGGYAPAAYTHPQNGRVTVFRQWRKCPTLAPAEGSPQF